MTPEVGNLRSALVSLLDGIASHSPRNIVCLNPLKKKPDKLCDGSKERRTNHEEQDANASVTPETRPLMVQMIFIQ